MNRDDIIKLAREAGKDIPNDHGMAEFLERFAALVIEQERKEFAAHAVEIARRAVAEENEACAKMAEDMNSVLSPDIAAAIRARMKA